jgi:cytochrome c6
MRKTIALLLALTVLALACGSTGPQEEPMELGAEAAISTGEQVYRMHCTLCHGANGKLGFNGAKDLTASALTKAEMMARVSEGKGTMQAYKNVLTAKEIDAVVEHVRKLGKVK